MSSGAVIRNLCQRQPVVSELGICGKDMEEVKKENRKMSSITRKLEWNWIGKKIGINLGFDLFWFLTFLAGWVIDCEIMQFGKIHLDYIRRLKLIRDSGKVIGRNVQLYYQIKAPGGQLLYELPLHNCIKVLLVVVAVVFVIQLLGILLSAGKEERKIRKILAPINEIALKADELSRMTFSEDKYQQIEDAIMNLSTEESALLSFGDKDLQGIETAMNNLLIRMRDSYRQQARFVNDASHELRTPIAVIEGYANMLERWGREDEKVLEESIQAILHESQNMKHLVEQLLFLARGDSGKTRINPEQVNLNEMMQEIYEESLMIDEDHTYRYVKPQETYKLQADAMLLKQAVRILVDNSAKYTQKGDEILLGLGLLDSGELYLQVQDMGIGMAEADVEHMFERFYRADDARGFDGTGLGLSIAKWIIDKHKGHFEILSRTELGTRIRIILPGKEAAYGAEV